MKWNWIPGRGKRLASLKRFLGRPWREKLHSIERACLHAVGAVPTRLSFGSWWLAYDDAVGQGILAGSFEIVESRFVENFLQPGMTVLDIGAHHGLYTLLAARKVGRTGRVLSFEPSPRERRKLLRHLRLNRCSNVEVEYCALGSSDGEADLFLVDGAETGCNSLRAPAVNEPTEMVRVPVKTLDSRLQSRDIEQVDFIKLDVEGGEWEVLKGASKLLDRRPRPVILCEVQDIRTQPWGYRAQELIAFLRDRNFQWFHLLADGGLQALDVHQTAFDGNFVAVPAERMEEIRVKRRDHRINVGIEVVTQS